MKLLLLLAMVHSVAANESIKLDPTESISVKQLVLAVLQANPRLEIAQASWQASVARIEQSAAFDDPQFQYSFAPFTINASNSMGKPIDFGQRFQLSQKLPFPGKLQLRAKAAEYKAETRQQNIATLQLLLTTSAKSLFADWYFIHQSIAINERKQSLLKQVYSITKTRYGTGVAGKQDVLRAELELTLLKHQTIVLQRQRKTKLAQLNTLLNRAVDTALSIPQQLTEIKQLPEFDQLKIKAMQSHPELMAIAADINEHETQSELAGLDYYPDLKLSAGYNSLWDNDDKRFNIAVGINIPLDQSKRRAAEQEAKANSQQAHWRKIDLLAKITEQLSIAYAHAEESLHVLQLYKQQLLPLAEVDLAAAKGDYQSGKGDFLTLLGSKKNLLQTQLQTEQALVNVHQRFAELEQAVGSLEPLSIAGK
ncbi:MAG: TolC family protein [Methylococcaceae bacterium]